LTLTLLLAGYGNVARRFVTLLDETRPALNALGIEPVITGVVTRRHGSVLEEASNDAGLDAITIARRLTEGRGRESASVTSALEWCARRSSGRAEARPGSQHVEARVLIETTTLDVRSGEPAISHVRAAFATGTHVVTANKGPVAFAYRALADEAAAAGVQFFFEGAVMDGIPVFNLVRETMPAVTIRGFRGVVNSTTNYLLTALERGESFERALADMQAAGVAEADPSLDVDGWDAAAKAAALANVWLDANTTPIAIPRAGIGPETAARAQAARAAGRRLKLVARGSGLGRHAIAGVALEEVERDDPLAILDGQANALELDTWPLGRMVIMQRGGGLEKTAYALLTDLIAVARRIRPR
jgi:homoserine dehydrogenase